MTRPIASLLGLALAGLCLACGSGGSPAPPANGPGTTAQACMCPPDSPSFRFTVDGQNFLPGSVVVINGMDRPTTYRDATRLTVFVDREGPFTYQVRNPAPQAGLSEQRTVGTASYTPGSWSVLASPSRVAAGGPGFTLDFWNTPIDASSVIVWNGRLLPTTVDVALGSARAAIPASEIALPGYGVAALYNPGKALGGITPAQIVNITVALDAVDLAPDPLSSGLVALGPGALLRVDPLTGGQATLAPLEAGLNRMALTAEGQYLYLGGPGTLYRHAWPSLTRQLTVPLGSDPVGNPWEAGRIMPLPGAPGSILINRCTPAVSWAARFMIFDDGVARPQQADMYTYAGGFTLDATGTHLYAIQDGVLDPRLYGFTVGPGGVALAGAGAVVPYSFTAGLGWAGGLLFSNSGLVLDPATLAVVKQGTPTLANTVLLVDAPNNRLFLANSDGLGKGRLWVYDLKTYTQVGVLSLNDMQAAPARIARWGQRGLAVLTAPSPMQATQVYLFESDMVQAY